MTALGVALLALADAPVQLVVALAAAGLVVAGVGRLIGVRDAGPWRARWLDGVLGTALLVVGALAALWRDAPLRTLAWVLAGVLVASGLTAIVQALRAPRTLRGWAEEARGEEAFEGMPGSERAAGVFGGLASVVVGALVLVWPRLSLSLFALVVGFWLAFSGIGMLVTVWRRRHRPAGTGWPGVRPRSAVRRQLSLVGAVGSFLVAVALAAGTVWLHNVDPRDEPDAFYTPPLAVPAEPGRLIRAERLAADRVPEGLRAWRILYTSTDGAARPTVVSGTVLAPGAGVPGAGVPGAESPRPESADDGEALPVVSVAHGTTGIVPRCAPSLAADPFADGASAALEQIVAEGWVAVTSDYVGLGTRGPHGYLVGPDAAHNVLDATRAARELDALELSAQTVVWGHSQGGHGALWTGIEAPSYAPEIDVLGVAVFAPAADLYAIAQEVRATTGGKLVSAYIAASWSQFYPQFDLAELVSPGYVGIVQQIEGHCFNGANVLGAFAIASQLTQEVFRPEAWEGEFADVLHANTPTGDIGVPVLVAQGSGDQLIFADQQREFVARRCSEGQPIDYREFARLDHVPLVAPESPLTPQLLDWTRDRLAGAPATPTC